MCKFVDSILINIEHNINLSVHRVVTRCDAKMESFHSIPIELMEKHTDMLSFELVESQISS